MTDINTNLAQQTNYRVSIQRLPQVVYNCQSVTIPGLTLGIARQFTPFVDAPEPGTELTFEPFTMRFLMNDDYSNWIEIATWMQGLGKPVSFDQYKALEDSEEKTRSDLIVTLFNSAIKATKRIQFHECFPISLSEIVLDSSTDNPEPMVATASFAYTRYEWLKSN